jgi:hypothetical protein
MGKRGKEKLSATSSITFMMVLSSFAARIALLRRKYSLLHKPLGRSGQSREGTFAVVKAKVLRLSVTVP